MHLPGFSAEASIYRSRRVYGSFPGPGAVAPGMVVPGLEAAVVPAYRPGLKTLASCNKCLGECDDYKSGCDIVADAILAGCLFPPACPAAVAASNDAHALCSATALACKGACDAFTCCPKLCGIPNPFDPGSGCCDHGEHCVDKSDLNARDGCCPADRHVCGGNCCDPLEYCCGDFCCPEGNPCCGGTCCPPDNHCCGDTCCPTDIPCCGGTCCSLLPPPGPPPTPPPAGCPWGSAPCGFPDKTGVIRTCCPPGLQCCFYSPEFGPDCRTNCVA